MNIFQISKKRNFMIRMASKEQDQPIADIIQALKMNFLLIDLILQTPKIFSDIFIRKIPFRMIFSPSFFGKKNSNSRNPNFNSANFGRANENNSFFGNSFGMGGGLFRARSLFENDDFFKSSFSNKNSLFSSF